MKNLPCIVFPAAIASLVILGIASTAGVSVEFQLVASYVVAIFSAAGLVATFVMDYGPRSSTSGERTSAAGTHASSAAAVGRRNALARRAAKAPGQPALEGALATLGLRSNPATVTLL